MQDKNIVIGVGNLLFYDDGIGVIAIAYLKKNYKFEPEIELLDGGTLGFSIVDYFLNYDNVLIIDTISTNEVAGTIYKIPSGELLGSSRYKNTAHEVEVVQMLEACELYDNKAKITVFGIIPQDINSVKIGLSEVLESRFEMLIESVLEEIEVLGINVLRANNVLVDEVIREFR
jgi:hydrogenase maturation protease